MSNVTNVILWAERTSSTELAPWLERIREFTFEGRTYPLVGLEGGAMPSRWYGGNAPLGSGLALGALNHLALEPFLAFLRHLPWERHGRLVQLLVDREEDDGFRWYPIFPLVRAAANPQREGALVDLETLYGRHEGWEGWYAYPPMPKNVPRLDLACLQYLESRGYLLIPPART